MSGKISGEVTYDVLAAIVPLYVAMFAAYVSVRWWRILTPEQCSGVNAYVAYWVVPFLIFKFGAESDPYAMNFRFLGADALQKVVILIAMLTWHGFSNRPDSLDWCITTYSLSTLPNTLVMGIPLFVSFYGDYAGELMVQIVFVQVLIWCTLLLVLFEYRAAVMLIEEKFPGEGIVSVEVEADVVSLGDKEQVDVVVSEVGEKGSVRVSLRRTMSLSSVTASGRSNLNGVEVCSTHSSRIGSRLERSLSSFDDTSDSDIGSGGGSERKKKSGIFHAFVQNSNTSRPPSMASDDILESETATGKNEKDVGEEEVARFELSKIEDEEKGGVENRQLKMPSQSVVMKLAITMAWRKLSRNPSIYASILSLGWALIANSRLHIAMPAIVKGSYNIIASGGIGMTMFSIGIFMGLQKKLIPCGMKAAAFAMFLRFIVSPAVIALTSIPFRLRGDLLRITILQAALPQAVLPFVYARQYDLHPELLSTAVIFGMLIALPISFLYYFLLGL